MAGVMEEGHVSAPDGAALAVSATGIAGPSMLLIPGLGATRLVFEPLLPLLSRRHRVISYDQRGVGESQLTDGPYSTEQLADDAAAVLAMLAPRGAAVLGASFGGMVAQQLAIRHGHRVTHLLLAATGPGYAHLAEAPRPQATAALLGRGARTPEDAYRLATTVLYSARFLDTHPAFVDDQVAQRAKRPVAARAFQAQFAASRGHDVWDELPSIQVPTLVMHGSDDRVMPLANARLLAARIPGARLCIFEDCGHLFFHEQPAQTVAAILEFVDG